MKSLRIAACLLALAGPAFGQSPISISPLPNSLSQGIVVNQSGPLSGSAAGPVAFNLFSATYNSATTGSGQDTTNNSNTGVVAFRQNFTVGGANLGGQAIVSGLFALAHTANSSAGDKIGLIGTVYSTANDTTGGLFGMNSNAAVSATGVAKLLVGYESDVGIASGGASINRIGIAVVSNAPVQGTTRDAAFLVSNINGSAVGAFNKLIQLSSLYGQAPIAINGDLFFADAAYTVGNVFNLSNMTVSGNILNFPNVVVSGTGRAVFGASSIPAAPVIVAATCASCGTADFQASTNTTTGLDGIDVLSSLSTSELVATVSEPNRTTTLFGITMGNYAQVYSAGSASNGLQIGTLTAKPLIFGTNNLFAGSVTVNQQWAFGANVAPASNVVLTLNKNAASPAAAVGGSTALFQISSADSVQPVVYVDSFGGAGTQPFIVTRTARGTGAAYTATQSGDNIGFFGMVGATAANTFAASDGTKGGVFFGAQATENWSATNQGAKLLLYATPNTTSTAAVVATFQAGIQVGAPTGGDKGAGTLNIAGAYWANGTTGVTCGAGISATTGRSVNGIITAC